MANVKIITQSYNASQQDEFIGVISAVPVYVLIPSLSSVQIGKTYIIKDVSNNASTYNITIGTVDQTQIDDERSQIITVDGGAITIVNTGTGWAISNTSNAATSSGGGISVVTSNLQLLVSDAGQDANPARTGTGGDLSSQPFLTLAGALDYLPFGFSGYTVTISYTRATSQTVTARGFRGGQLIIADAILGISSFTGIEDLVLQGVVLQGKVTITDSTSSVEGSASGSGCLEFVGGRHEVELQADGCSQTALKGNYCQQVVYGIDANTCTAIVVDLVACQYSELGNIGLTGTNAGASYAVRLSGGGKHVLTGATITSATADALDLDGYPTNWTALGTENYVNASTYAFWADNLWVLVGRFRVYNNSSQDFDDFIVRDLQYNRFFKQYGVTRPLDPAYKEITAHAGGGQASATAVGYQQTIVTVAASAGDSIRLLSTADVAGIGGGSSGAIVNRTASNVSLYPPSGKKLYRNGTDLGANNSTTITPGSRVSWLCDNSDNFEISG